jgi:hypothetical protein
MFSAKHFFFYRTPPLSQQQQQQQQEEEEEEEQQQRLRQLRAKCNNERNRQFPSDIYQNPVQKEII